MARRWTGWGLVAALVSLAAPAPARAQIPTTSAGAVVTLSVVQELSVRGIKDLDFGDVVTSSGGVTKDVGKADPNAGQFEVAGGDGQGVRLRFVAPRVLEREEGPGSLPVDISLYAAPTPASAAGAEEVFAEGTVILRDGRYYLFVAGSITVGDVTANPAGTYSGEFELSVAYTTI